MKKIFLAFFLLLSILVYGQPHIYQWRGKPNIGLMSLDSLLRVKSTIGIGFSSGDAIITAADVALKRQSANTIRLTNGSTGFGNLELRELTFTGRELLSQGADVASASNITLGSDGNTFEITGTTQINLIANTNWINGSEITLLFTSTPTVKNGQTTSGSNITIVLAGAADFVATANDVLTLVLVEIGGTQMWLEKSRSVN